jgi:hypothetical protein
VESGGHTTETRRLSALGKRRAGHGTEKHFNLGSSPAGIMHKYIWDLDHPSYTLVNPSNLDIDYLLTRTLI